VTADAGSLRSFVLRAFLWLAPCFAAWYYLASIHSMVAGRLAWMLIGLVAPGVVSDIEREGFELVFVTTLEVHPAPGLTAVLMPQVNPLLYTYGLALFVAMMLGSRRGWRPLLAGSAMLLPFQGWGIAFDLLSQLAINLGPDIAVLAGLADWRREAIALGYQVGALMLPSLAPVMLWAAFNRSFMQRTLAIRDCLPGHPT
jgi:hypothetical protein